MKMLVTSALLLAGLVLTVSGNDTKFSSDVQKIEGKGNPLGTCECDGQLWMNDACTEAFYCDSDLDNSGLTLFCPPVRCKLTKLPRLMLIFI